MKPAKLIAKFLPLLLSIGTITFLFSFSPSVASAKVMTPAASCWGATCAGKDPTQMDCLGSVHILPYKMPEYYQGTLVGYFSSVYSNTCNANWNEAELTPYAISQGWRVSTLISTTDSNNQTESISFPTQNIIDIPGGSAGRVVPGGSAGQVIPGGSAGQVTSGNGAGQVVPGGSAGQVIPGGSAGRVIPAGYGGETGWPTVSNMVDGTHQTTSTFYLRNRNGNLLGATIPVLKQ